MKSSNSGEARNIKDRQPFCWQEKKALETIRQSFEGDTASALATYLALTEIASDSKSETFQASANYIAGKAGLSGKTVERRIPSLEECGLIAIKRSKIPGKKARETNTYTLLKLRT